MSSLPMSSIAPDAVVVGAGPNGLVAANVLVDAGWSVLVLEAGERPGGSVRSAELTLPGYVHDVCSAFYPFGVGDTPIARLDLEAHGLRWCHAPAVLAHPTLEGPCATLWRDLDRTAASLDADHPGDGEAWRALHQRWLDVRTPLVRSLFRPMPPLSGMAGLARLGPRELARLARFLLLPVRRLGEEHFAGAAARRLLAGAALHADLSPEATLSGFYGWLLCAVGQDHGFPVPEGGASQITKALVSRLEERGGQVLCDAPVDRVILRAGRAAGVHVAGLGEIPAGRAVLADVPAPVLYTRLVTAGDLPDGVLGDVARFHWDDATCKVDWALDGPIPWQAEGARAAGTVHVADDVDALTVMASELARGLVPARPFLLVGQQGQADPTRQPPGHDTAWAYAHLPRTVRGDAGGTIDLPWDEAAADAFARRMEAQIEELAPGFRDRICGRHVHGPADLEQENPSLLGGAINGGTSQLHQQLLFRPIPGLGRASTPIRQLYLASSSAHPGGGVHGAPGANAARAALASRPGSWLVSQAKRTLRPQEAA
jgi:phytoene dehydrogenase-like protein